MGLFKLLHVLAVVVWVGGMFFAYMVLRPAAAELLAPPERLRLWDQVLARFFNWVWLALLLLLSSGLYLIYLYGGVAAVGRYVHVMLLLGIVMLSVFLYVYFFAHVRLNRAVAARKWEEGAAALATVRRWVGINLILGGVTLGVALLGRGY